MNVTDIPITALVLRHNPDALKPQTAVVVPPVPPVTPQCPPAQPPGPGIDQDSEEAALNDFLLSELVDSAPPFAGGGKNN